MTWQQKVTNHIDGLVQDCINSSMLAMELLQSFTKPSNCEQTMTYMHYGNHYNDVIMSAIVSQITSLTSLYSTVYSDADQRKHQSSASLAFVRGIHWWIPCTKGQWREKCFHLMTSSCQYVKCQLTSHVYRYINNWLKKRINWGKQTIYQYLITES